jgi:hypothetical protein
MNKVIPIHLAVEDLLSEAVLRMILRQSGKAFEIGSCFRRRGFGYLRKKIEGFNNAAKGTPFLVLTDLDQSECPPILIREWLVSPKQANLIFRIAVRSVESWLLAHRKALARFFGIPEKQIPTDPDEIENPKQFLIQSAAKSPKREIRAAIVPAPQSTAFIGPDYNGKLIEFVEREWQAREAAKYSPSLERALAAITSFRPIYK